MFNSIIIILGVVCIISIIINIIFILYIRRVLLQVYNASEEASLIFTRLNAFEEHLQTVYDLPTFYGDETLSGLLNHIKELSNFLHQYENVYSFTQPDLLEQLEAASMELQEKYDQEETKEEE